MILTLIFLLLYGMIDGLMDRLQFHIETMPEKIQMSKFWNPENSWRNKWKDGDPFNGEKFFLSSTVLVFLTDGWHLLKELKLQSISLFMGLIISTSFGWSFILCWLSCRALISIGFKITYK